MPDASSISSNTSVQTYSPPVDVSSTATTAKADNISGASTLIMDGKTAAGGLSNSTLLATLQALPTLAEPLPLSPEQFQDALNDMANSLSEDKNPDHDDSGRVVVTKSDTSSSSSSQSIGSRDRSESSDYEATAQGRFASASVDVETSNDLSATANLDAGDSTVTVTDTSTDDTTTTTDTPTTETTTTTDTTTTTTDTVSMTTILNELAGLDIAISATAEVQNNALISSVNSESKAAIAAGNQTIASGNDLMKGAMASFLTAAVFTGVTIGVTGMATSAANKEADAEVQTQTNDSMLASEKATTATAKAAQTGTPEDMAAARQANTDAKLANNKLNNSSAVKQQNDQTIAANNKALDAKESGKTTDVEDNLATAKESQQASSDLINGKASLQASSKAIDATERYQKNPTPENRAAAEDAHKNAETANNKLSDNSAVGKANKKTLDDNEAAIGNTTKAHFDKAGKPVAPDKIDIASKNEASTTLATAKKSQAKASEAQPKSIYVKTRLGGSQSAMQTFQTKTQQLMVFNALSEQTTNLIGTVYQTKAKVAEGNAQKESAYSAVFAQDVTSTNTAMTALYTLAGDLRSSSSTVAQDIIAMVQATKSA